MDAAFFRLGACLAGMAMLSAAVAAQEQSTARLLGLVHYQEPVYPLAARTEGIWEGAVNLAILWDEHGHPADIVVLRATNPRFGEAAIEAASAWRRSPQGAGEVTLCELRFNVSGVVICSAKMLSAYLSEKQARRDFRLPVREQLDAPPLALAQPMPVFPEALQGTHGAGRVVVEFFVDETGRVRAPQVRESSGKEFTAETLAALREWRFSPPLWRGRPVVYPERWVFDFKRTG